jgi:hypothetical protein
MVNKDIGLGTNGQYLCTPMRLKFNVQTSNFHEEDSVNEGTPFLLQLRESGKVENIQRKTISNRGGCTYESLSNIIPWIFRLHIFQDCAVLHPRKN